ncbi:hypothetical protein D3C78_1757540 [compost metagenome]
MQVGVYRLIVFDCLAGEIVVTGKYCLDRAEQFAEAFLLAHIARSARVHAAYGEQRRGLGGQHQNLQRQGHGLEAGKHL